MRYYAVIDTNVLVSSLLTERADARTIPIIALTANAFEEDVQQCLQAGMNEHLSKPVDIDVLVSTLGRLIAR